MSSLKEPLILVVEDSKLNVMLLEETLGEKYDLAVALDGQSALEALAEEKPDLILLDIILPDIDGFTIMERIQDDPATADIPVIFLSGRSDAADLEKGKALGARDFIAKPFDAADVINRVRACLGR